MAGTCTSILFCSHKEMTGSITSVTSSAAIQGSTAPPQRPPGGPMHAGSRGRQMLSLAGLALTSLQWKTAVLCIELRFFFYHQNQTMVVFFQITEK